MNSPDIWAAGAARRLIVLVRTFCKVFKLALTGRAGTLRHRLLPLPLPLALAGHARRI